MDGSFGTRNEGGDMNPQLQNVLSQVEHLTRLVMVLVGPLGNQVTGAQVGGRVLSGEGVSSGETGSIQGGAITKDACQEITGKGLVTGSQGSQINGQTSEYSFWRGLSHVEPPSYHTNNITNPSVGDCNLSEFRDPAIVQRYPSPMTVNQGSGETRKGPVGGSIPEIHNTGSKPIYLDLNNHMSSGPSKPNTGYETQGINISATGWGNSGLSPGENLGQGQSIGGQCMKNSNQMPGYGPGQGFENLVVPQPGQQWSRGSGDLQSPQLISAQGMPGHGPTQSSCNTPNMGPQWGPSGGYSMTGGITGMSPYGQGPGQMVNSPGAQVRGYDGVSPGNMNTPARGWWGCGSMNDGSNESSLDNLKLQLFKQMKFKGDLKWKPFCRKFMGMTQMNGWSDEDRANMLIHFLDGTALEYYFTITSREENMKWDELNKHFEARFGGDDLVSAARMELQGCKQKPKESIQEWADRVFEICTRAIPSVAGKEFFDETAVQHFAAGAYDVDASRELLTRLPRSLPEAVEQYKKVQFVQRMVGRKMVNQVRGEYEDTYRPKVCYAVSPDRNRVIPSRSPSGDRDQVTGRSHERSQYTTNRERQYTTNERSRGYSPEYRTSERSRGYSPEYRTSKRSRGYSPEYRTNERSRGHSPEYKVNMVNERSRDYSPEYKVSERSRGYSPEFKVTERSRDNRRDNERPRERTPDYNRDKPNTSRGSRECYYCHEQGHFARECPRKRESRSRSVSPHVNQAVMSPRGHGGGNLRHRKDTPPHKKRVNLKEERNNVRAVGTAESTTSVNEVDQGQSGSWLVELEVNGVITQAIVDTGAEITMVSHGLFEQMNPKPRVVTETTVRTALHGAQMHTFRVEPTTLKMGNNSYELPICVGPLQDSMLLGLDFLRANKVLVDTFNGELLFGNDRVKLTSTNTVGRRASLDVVAVRRIQLPAKYAMPHNSGLPKATDSDIRLDRSCKRNLGAQKSAGTQSKRKRSPGVPEGAKDLSRRNPGVYEGAGSLSKRNPGVHDGAGSMSKRNPGVHDGAGSLSKRNPGVHDGAGSLSKRNPGVCDGAGSLPKRNPGVCGGAGDLSKGNPGVYEGAGDLSKRYPVVHKGAGDLAKVDPGAQESAGANPKGGPDVKESAEANSKVGPDFKEGAGDRSKRNLGVQKFRHVKSMARSKATRTLFSGQ